MQYQIGDFARMAQISTKQLKYYEQCGLIAPARVDELSGYRFYEAEQLRDVAHIRAFLNMGFTTAEIKALLPEGDYSAAFDKKQRQLEAEMEQNRRRLALLDFYRQASREGGFNQPYRATVKTSPSGLAAAERWVFPDPEALAEEWKALLDQVQDCGATPTGKLDTAARFFDPEFTPEYFDAELLLFLEKPGQDSSSFEYRQLQPQRAITVIHNGSYDFIHEAYAFAYMWADRNNYRPTGLPLERYLVGPHSERPEEEYVTVLYIPIED